MTSELILTIGRRVYPVADLAEASKLYSELRDLSGLGASQWPQGRLSNGLTISYNGRVWRGAALVSEAVAYERKGGS